MRSWMESPSIPTIVPYRPPVVIDFVAVFQGVEHFLGFLLAALRGKNQQHIKNDHDDDQGREGHQASGAASLGHQGTNFPVKTTKTSLRPQPPVTTIPSLNRHAKIRPANAMALN